MKTGKYPQKQAVAIALSNARRHPHRARGGIIGDRHYATGGLPFSGPSPPGPSPTPAPAPAPQPAPITPGPAIPTDYPQLPPTPGPAIPTDYPQLPPNLSPPPPPSPMPGSAPDVGTARTYQAPTTPASSSFAPTMSSAPQPRQQSGQSSLFGYGNQPNFGYSPQFTNLLSNVMGYGGFSPAQGWNGNWGGSAGQFMGQSPPSSSPLSNPFASGNSNFLPTGYAPSPPPAPASPPPPPAPAPTAQPQSQTPAWTGNVATSNMMGGLYAQGGVQTGNFIVMPDGTQYLMPGIDPNNWGAPGGQYSPYGTANNPILNAGSSPSTTTGGFGQARGGGIRGYQSGGLMPGTESPETPTTANPNYQTAAQQYKAMSPQELQQLVSIYGASSPRGQIASTVLQQKRLMPSASLPAQTNPAALPTSARGGPVDEPGHYDIGGAVGYLHGDTPGRTDVLHISPPGGSYVVPADVVSGLGDGNSIAGAAVLNKALGMGPYGTTPQGRHSPGLGIPRPPPFFSELQPKLLNQVTAKRGGKTAEKGVGQPTPIVAASGEFIISPDVVRRIGGGDITRGHQTLDAYVLKKRRETIQKMRKLQPPKKR